MNLVPVNGPTDLPELRNWLLHRYRPGGSLHNIDGAFVERAIQAAQLWWVEEETCHLLAESAPTWPDDGVLDIADMPTAAGFAVFASDIQGTDALSEEMVRVSAILWGPVTLPPLWASPRQQRGFDGFYEEDGRIGLGIGMFTRFDLHKGLSALDLTRAADTMAALADRETKDLYFSEGGNEGTMYSFIGRTDWLPGSAVTEIEPDSPSASNPHGVASMAEDRKLLAALWALTRTSVVETVSHHPPRAVARRSERRNLSADVKVLRLGGTHQQNVGWSPVSSKRDWKHSWIVSPHFRWQAHGPQWSERKLILVGPYKKGPDDAPLLGSNRVWRVVPPGGEK